MGDTPSRQALKDKVRRERRQAVGISDRAEETSLELVRDDGSNQAQHFWDKKRGRANVAAWVGVGLVFAASVAVAFVVGFAAMYLYEATR
ncbi:hypothetical protein HN371_10965 [Candidatus Poribacteria bacterium]|nr:hypothetical protein [Candidatus Poribacteria bacterium]MBT5531992.1 hypothetical protein [Candidatus Poribacteria bacterium]MBT5713165.1 hypothetical protein [Candidatus Poribacteria bacterium]MBT7097467.1 hypothetical protein [Candidatus Poribacteria bacterium]MBT7808621.1 hypothetical protein [Candidatus Poribacteria bacterium]